MPHLTLLFIGDVFGKPGRDLVRLGVPKLVRRYEVTAVIANGENSAGGFGITRETGEELFAAGVDLMTSGNHVWDKKEALDYLPLEPRLVRPANFPAGVPVPSNHNSGFAPVPEPTIITGVTTMTAAVLELLGKS